MCKWSEILIMKKSAIKSRITILLVSSSVFTLFGLVENYTDWLFTPIKCYEINSKTNTLKETKESKDFCIEHVYLPYQRKQGSVKLGIRTKLNGEKYLYTTTTFWIADKIGAEKFSDVEGDFTTDVMKIYNSSGLVKFNKLDIGLPNETAPYPTNEYRAYCDRRPIFLNDLFMDHKCLDKQKLVWKKIQEISPNSFNNYLIPFSKLIFRWVSSNPFKILGGVFFLIAFTRFYPLLNFSKNSSEDTKVSSSISIEEDIKKIKKVTIRTHESAIRIIDKTGPLNNPADRDHCIQYMVAIGLLYGNLEAKHYEDSVAEDPRIDELRNKIVCIEDKQFSQDYLLPSKRSIANGVQIELAGGVKLPEVIVEYPLGHKNRRNEGIPILIEKFRTNMKSLYTEKEIDLLVDFFSNIDNFQKHNSDFLFEILWKRDSGPNI